MRRPAWLRALIGVFGLWFTATLLEAPGIHACAVHSGTTSHQHGAPASPGPAASHAAAHTGVHGSPASPAPHEAACTCIGLCCGASPVTSPKIAIPLSPTRLVATDGPAQPRDIAVVTARRYARPFANGPPVLG